MFDNLKRKLTEYFQLKTEILRLEALEYIVKSIAALLFVSIAVMILLVSGVFLSIGLAVLLNDYLDSTYAGYLIIGGVLLLKFVFILLLRKQLLKYCANKLVHYFTTDKQARNHTDQNPAAKQ